MDDENDPGEPEHEPVSKMRGTNDGGAVKRRAAGKTAKKTTAKRSVAKRKAAKKKR